MHSAHAHTRWRSQNWYKSFDPISIQIIYNQIIDTVWLRGSLLCCEWQWWCIKYHNYKAFCHGSVVAMFVLFFFLRLIFFRFTETNWWTCWLRVRFALFIYRTWKTIESTESREIFLKMENLIFNGFVAQFVIIIDIYLGMWGNREPKVGFVGNSFSF